MTSELPFHTVVFYSSWSIYSGIGDYIFDPKQSASKNQKISFDKASSTKHVISLYAHVESDGVVL